MENKKDDIESLLNALRGIPSNQRQKHIENNKSTWSLIGSKDIVGAGFDNESEMLAWMENNDYGNI